MFNTVLAYFGLVTRRRYECDMAEAERSIGELQNQVVSLCDGKAALERQARNNSKTIERLRESCEQYEGDKAELRGACEERLEHLVRLSNALHIVRQVLDEAGVPRRHELEENGEADDVGPDEIANGQCRC